MLRDVFLSRSHPSSRRRGKLATYQFDSRPSPPRCPKALEGFAGDVTQEAAQPRIRGSNDLQAIDRRCGSNPDETAQLSLQVREQFTYEPDQTFAGSESHLL